MSDLRGPAAELAEAARLRDVDVVGDEKKRQALVRLRDRYIEAQNLVSSHEPYDNLEWILGARRNPTHDPLGLQPQTVELVALWLQDLTAELDSGLADPSLGDPAGVAMSAQNVRQAVARKLREATERFVAAFRCAPPVDGGSCA